MPRWLVPLFAVALTSAAHGEPPRSYRKLSPGGRFVFVMLAPDAAIDELARTPPGVANGIRAIRKQYSQSGLYRNDGSATPEWAVEWWADGVEVSSDGAHVVRRGPLPRAPDAGGKPDLSGEAVSFFAGGRLAKTYAVADLVGRPDKLRRAGEALSWLAESNLDDGGSEYTLTTQDGGKFAFDIRTGEMLRSDPARRVPRWAWPAGVGAVAAAVLAVWRRRRVTGRVVSAPRVNPA